MVKGQEITREQALSNWWDEPIYLKKIKTGELYRIRVETDSIAESPREWDNVCTIFSRANTNWSIGDDGFRYSSSEAMKKLAEYEKRAAAEEILLRPVYMYDHSGQTISLSPFGDVWDSGICAYIFVEKKRIFKYFPNATEEDWKEYALKTMKSEIEIYDNYITGEVYDFVLEKAEIIEHKNVVTGETWRTSEWSVEDSCGGYYGDPRKTSMFEDAMGKDFIFIYYPEEN